eukprot:scaffold2681_cov196-Pinguiococcus_pyrenoidosus.AAC.1
MHVSSKLPPPPPAPPPPTSSQDAFWYRPLPHGAHGMHASNAGDDTVPFSHGILSPPTQRYPGSQGR